MSPKPRSSPTPKPDIPGYRSVELIGVGGMASVYLAVQESLSRQVAIKLLNQPDDGSRYERFLNESRIIASLNHRNVITIYDIGTVAGRPYISMEYLEGGDLQQRLDTERVDPAAALTLIETMGRCLSFVHEHGIIHRDIKPANILFHKDGTPILTDFGLAKHQDLDKGLTVDGTTVGTPYYLSPEQAECKPLDGRTDIYGLGVILYEMLVGVKPYDGVSAMQTIAAHLMNPIPTLPSQLSQFQDLIDRMLAKDPVDRFATAGEMAEHVYALRQLLRMPAGRAHSTLDRAGHRDVVRRGRDVVRRGCEVVLDAVDALLAPDGLVARVRRLVSTLSLRDRVVGSSLLAAAAGVLLWHVVTRPPETVATLLSQAETALADDRLSYPKADSAFNFYEQVLDLEPDNPEARRGLTRIAERYADRAEQEISASQFPNARFYVQRGLEVQPGNARLLQLEREIKPLNTVPQKITNGFRSIFGRSRDRDD